MIYLVFGGMSVDLGGFTPMSLFWCGIVGLLITAAIIYITEYYDGRVSIRDGKGETRVLRDDLPGANGITFHRGRLFVDECRPGGRLMEVDPAGGAPRVLLDGLPMPNALEAGPDGKLYYPLLGSNEIWRIDPDGGEPERVAADLREALRDVPAARVEHVGSTSVPAWRPSRCSTST